MHRPTMDAKLKYEAVDYKALLLKVLNTTVLRSGHLYYTDYTPEEWKTIKELLHW